MCVVCVLACACACAPYSSSQLGGSSFGVQLVGLDCEMVQTEDDDCALVRVTLVRLAGVQPGEFPSGRDVLLDMYVRPEGKVRDFAWPASISMNSRYCIYF